MKNWGFKESATEHKAHNRDGGLFIYILDVFYVIFQGIKSKRWTTTKDIFITPTFDMKVGIIYKGTIGNYSLHEITNSNSPGLICFAASRNKMNQSPSSPSPSSNIGISKQSH